MFYKFAATVVLVTGVVLTGSCTPQTTSGEKETVRNKNSESVNEDGGEVGIDDGSKVLVPPGALAVGSEVTVQKVADDESFAAGGEAASDTVEFSGTGPDGVPLEQASQPMTVALSINSGTALHLTGSVDDMCVMLKTISGKQMIWRRTLLTIDETGKKVSLQSLFFGKYKAVYCGVAAIAGFEEAGDTGATGEAPLTISMTIPAELFAGIEYGKYCLALAREKDGDSCKNSAGDSAECKDNLMIITGSEAFKGTADVEMTLAVNAGSITSDYKYIVGISLLEKASECVMTVGKNLGETGPGDTKAFYAFIVNPEQIKSGLSGVIGAGDPYNLTTFNLKLGGVGSFAALTPHDEANVCLDVEGKMGKTLTLVSFAGGKINGQVEAKILAASPTTGQIDRLRMYVGARCDNFGIDFSTVDATTGKPYEFASPVAPSATIMATPIVLGITSSNPLLAGKNGCLKVFVPGGSTSSDSDLLGRSMINFSQPSYKVYLPYLTDTKYQSANGTPKYDMEITALNSGNCDSAGEAANQLMSFPRIPNKELNGTISVQLNL